MLTRVDKVEEKVNEIFAAEKKTHSEHEKEAKLRELIDMKIESVVLRLGIPRASVHFIENYHENCIFFASLHKKCSR